MNLPDHEIIHVNFASAFKSINYGHSYYNTTNSYA